MNLEIKEIENKRQWNTPVFKEISVDETLSGYTTRSTEVTGFYHS